MKRSWITGILCVAIAFVSENARGQIAAWNLTSTTTTATTIVGGLSASAINAVPTTSISYQTNPGDIYCGTWSTSGTFSTTGKYWEFSVTPGYGYAITISSLTFKAGRTAAGPQKTQAQYSLDGFATNGTTALGETAVSNTTGLDLFTLTALPPATSNTITIRIWGYGASGTGNFRLNNIVINGTVANTLNPGSGIGLASVSPTRWKFNTPTTLQFVIKPGTDTINGVQIIRPSVLNWNTGSILVAPDSLTPSVIGDTVQISDIAMQGQDSLVVTFPGVTALDSTDNYSITVQTFKGASPYGRIQTLPQMLIYGSPRPMSWIKAKDGTGQPLLLGKYVVAQGVVTVSNEFGVPAYMQDATAGIAVYDTSVAQNTTRGDEIVVLGIVSPYSGLFELNPCSLLQVVSQGNPVDTSAPSIAQIKAQPQNGVEPYECRLIRVNNVNSVLTASKSPASTWAVTGSGTTYLLVSGSDTLQTYVKSNNSIANTATPSGKFDMVGVLGQFYTDYQILPRMYDDIIVEGAGPRIISGAPYESNITSTSLTFTWQTDGPGSTIVNYGTTNSYGSIASDTTGVTSHQVTLTGLAPATIYHVKLGSANSIGTTYTNDYIVSTASQSSTETMNVYFNYPVNTTLAHGDTAHTVAIVDKLLARINAATYSIDAALYSLSGTVGANVASALIAAKGRGVKVRVIGEYDNHSTAPWTTLTSNGITVIFDNYDAANGGLGLMHNKFVVIDNRDTTSDTDDWVWTGSWNATDPGNNNDAQNVIEIQDKALANAYTTEFNEMWGSNTDTPNAANSRFGAHKLDNTPHFFTIGGTPVELYFSPSDGTTSKIIKTLNKSVYSIDFGILTFTRNDIANVLIAKHKAGQKVHGVMDNRTDQGSVFDTLVASGVDVHLKGSAVTGLFHHKYGLVDAETWNPQQYVITGSHNWSSSAENANNENTLIINSARIANLYEQEFSARYAEAGGADVLTGVEKVPAPVPTSFQLLQNYPNPFNPSTVIGYQIPHSATVELRVFDILGREVASLVHEQQVAGVYQVRWNASNLSSGIYFYQLKAGKILQTKKLLLVK